MHVENGHGNGYENNSSKIYVHNYVGNSMNFVCNKNVRNGNGKNRSLEHYVGNDVGMQHHSAQTASSDATLYKVGATPISAQGQCETDETSTPNL
eukprot:4110196-Amphidinium_carterae.1